MKILVVIHSFPWPPRIGSALVAYNSIKELAKRHSVSMVCRERPKDEGDLAAVLEDLQYPDSRGPQIRSKLAKLLLAFRGIPPLIADTVSQPMEQSVAERANRFDAILLFELHAIQYCPASVHHMVVANIEDPPSIKLGLYSRLSVYSLGQRLRLLLEAKLLAWYEKRVLPPLARVLLLSEADVNAMRKAGGHLNLGHVFYGTEARSSEGATDWNERTPGAIVFSGNMWHRPNVDGALFFLREVFPLVVQQTPSAVLWIVGARPDKRIKKAARPFSDRVKITGLVPDIAVYLKQACVSICPVRVRVGVQTKILEAMSVGTPVVSTSAGNAGIGGVSGKHLWETDEPAEFASRVVELLGGGGWPRMSEEGRKLVLTDFSWQRSVAALETYLSRVARNPVDSPRVRDAV